MSEPIVRAGEKVHVAVRRAFEDDVRRHLVGVVEAASDRAIRVRGHAFVHDSARNEWERHASERTRVISLTDAGNVIHLLPDETELADVEYRYVGGKVVVTDGTSLRLEINEFGADR